MIDGRYSSICTHSITVINIPYNLQRSQQSIPKITQDNTCKAILLHISRRNALAIFVNRSSSTASSLGISVHSLALFLHAMIELKVSHTQQKIMCMVHTSKPRRRIMTRKGKKVFIIKKASQSSYIIIYKNFRINLAVLRGTYEEFPEGLESHISPHRVLPQGLQAAIRKARHPESLLD